MKTRRLFFFVMVLTIVIWSNGWTSPFGSLHIALDDPMLRQIYDFTDRMLLRYDFYPFHQHRRPYTQDQLLRILQFFRNRI